MEDLRLPKSVRRVVLLGRQTVPGGAGVRRVVLDRKKKKKGTKLLRPLERLVRKSAKAQQALTDTYVRRHGRSNEKKKDGWLRDLSVNVARATAKGARKIRPKRLSW